MDFIFQIVRHDYMKILLFFEIRHHFYLSNNLIRKFVRCFFSLEVNNVLRIYYSKKKVKSRVKCNMIKNLTTMHGNKM